jgi:hypothetical protein
MSTSTYCVRFTSITSYKVTVKAKSEHDATRIAKLLWEHGNSDRFTAFAGETHDWDAELVAFRKGGAS